MPLEKSANKPGCTGRVAGKLQSIFGQTDANGTVEAVSMRQIGPEDVGEWEIYIFRNFVGMLPAPQPDGPQNGKPA